LLRAACINARKKFHRAVFVPYLALLLFDIAFRSNPMVPLFKVGDTVRIPDARVRGHDDRRSDFVSMLQAAQKDFTGNAPHVVGFDS
jgi:hypothetical protein